MTLSNNGLASGESEGYLAGATLVLEVPSSFAGRLLPPARNASQGAGKIHPQVLKYFDNSIDFHSLLW
jgi:hypothetical protein